ncbi:MAG: ring-opening amidohydrolase [Roseobacter sp.]
MDVFIVGCDLDSGKRIAVVGKTEGNGYANGCTRSFAVSALKHELGETAGGWPAPIATTDAPKSLRFSHGAFSFGVVLALGEIDVATAKAAKIGSDRYICSGRINTSAGIELMACEIVVLGGSGNWTDLLTVDGQ